MSLSPAVLHRLGGEGPPILCIHGFGADRLGWAANAHALMTSHNVWAVDLPGHGGAGNALDPNPDPTALARSVAGAISPLSGPVSVIGHSLGGAVALWLARLMPERIGTMALIAPATGATEVSAAFLDGFAAMTTVQEAEAVLSMLCARPGLIAPMIPHVLASLAQPGRRAALRAIADALAVAPPAPAPPPGSPVTVIWGDGDTVIPAPAGPLWGVSATVIPGTGHLPHLEKAGSVNRILSAALAER